MTTIPKLLKDLVLTSSYTHDLEGCKKAGIIESELIGIADSIEWKNLKVTLSIKIDIYKSKN